MTPIRRAVITVATIVAVGLGVAGAPTAAAAGGSDVEPVNVEVVHDEAFNEVVERVEHRDGSVSVVISSSLAGTAETTSAARNIDDACAGREAHHFSDIGSSAHASSIACLVGLYVTNGLTPWEYGPNREVSRAQMASFVVRALDVAGARIPRNAPDAFADDHGSVHESAINRLAAVGVIAGTGPSSFSPGRSVTRAQMATFVVRAAELYSGSVLPAASGVFSDIGTHTLAPSIAKAAQVGIAAGTGTGRYLPNEPVTRAQMASFLARLLDLLVAEHGAQLPDLPKLPAPPPRPTTTTTVPPATTTTRPPATPPVASAPAAPAYHADHAFIFPAGPNGTTGPARWNPCQVVTYSVNTSGATGAQVDAVLAGLYETAKATGIAMQPVASGAQMTVSFVPASDSRVAGSVVGRAHVNSRWSWGSPNAWISHADVVFDRDDLSRAAPTNGAGGTWGSVARHEFGHAFGLAHAATTEQVMYPSLSSRTPAPWGPGDRYGLYQLGAAQGC